MGFKIPAAGLNARIPQALPPLLSPQASPEGVDAHRIQPFYTGLLAKDCGLSVEMANEGDAVVVMTR